MKRFFILILAQFIFCLCSGQTQNAIPEIVIPVYEKVKDLKQEIPFVKNGQSVCSIATPSIYMKDAEQLQTFILKKTGTKIPIISDSDPEAATPLKGNLIILGNRSTSKVSSELYDRYYSLMDLKYPGPGGYSVRSLHNPYGNGFSALLIGGSDTKGVSEGTAAFISSLANTGSSGNMSAGWTMLTKFGEGVKIPTTQKEFETWEASKGYGSTGYFGWNSISKHMAMYYMTGNPFHAREFLRLSFPDAQALKEIDAVDGERIENKKDPLAGPYHYNSMMLILFWDLIEESPVFSDSVRLRITNAFARRLDHEGTHPFDKNTYKLNEVPEFVGSRHIQWCALPVFTLGRYFNKYYPSPMWAQCERAGKLAFASLHQHEWVESGSDCSGVAPVLTYMILSGDMVPLKNGVLAKLLKRMEITMTGLTPDKSLNYAALDFLNKAAYLTGDGRWITYCQRTGLNTDIFRLGQSFWPGDNIKPGLPEGYFGKWLVYNMPEPMWKTRNNQYKLEQSFINMSYRNTLDATGDYVLVDGNNEAYRNPYHTYDIIELRLNGATVMRGFYNQLIASVDGMVEPKVAMDGALIHNDVVGEVADVIGEIPTMGYVNWRRSLALRSQKYVLIADAITFKKSATNSSSGQIVRLETNWEMPGSEWNAEKRVLKINPDEKNIKNLFELHSSEIMEVRPGKIISMIWKESGKEGERRTFFHLIGQKTPGTKEELSNFQLTANASALALPEAAVAVSGKYQSIDGELVLLSEKTLYGHELRSAGLDKKLFLTDHPVEADWEYENGTLTVVNSNPVKISLAISNPQISVDGKQETGKKDNDLYVLELSAGRHKITGAIPSLSIKKSLSVNLTKLLDLARENRTKELNEESRKVVKHAAEFTPVLKTSIAENPVGSVVIPSKEGDLYCAARGNILYVLDSKGKEVRRMTTAGEIKVLQWWPEPQLLLAGCLDEKVVAFNVNGNKKWEFTSVMDPAVYEAAKTYWFKSAYPGISGINTGIFDDGKSRAFIGSACTLEILDQDGRLVKRLPVFWGPGRHFLVVDAPDGSKNVLVDRWNNDFVDFVIINSKKMKEVGRGYDEVPDDHTSIGGWEALNRYDNFLTDVDGDGKKEVISAVNGLWNRITIYTENGKPLYNAQFGPGIKGPRTTMRMVDIGDLNDDGKQEIIVAHSAGYVTVLDCKAKKIWSKSLLSPPTVVKLVKQSEKKWICVGCEDGTIMALDNKGNCLKQGKVNGKPMDMKVLQTPKELISVTITEQGEIAGFVLNQSK